MLTEPYVVPATPLTDTDGAPYSLADSTDKRLTLVFFGYTHCPDICQVVMQTLASAMTRLDDADREQVDVVFVTTDPARDDEAALRDYLDRFDPAFIGLTGPLPTIIDIGETWPSPSSTGRSCPVAATTSPTARPCWASTVTTRCRSCGPRAPARPSSPTTSTSCWTPDD